MDKYVYECYNCGKEYIPTRRLVQKYCSNSCRTRAFMLRNTKTKLSSPNSDVEFPNKKLDSTKIDQMSIAGVGNAVAGVAVIKLAESLFTSEANKPATKKDLKNLESKLIARYYPINNLDRNVRGLQPYFDVEYCIVVYLE